jgi:BlaI family penicillinase repressor
MSEVPRISDAEWKVLGVLWKNSPLTASQIFDQLAAREWKLNTVRTFLTRLENKGVIAAEDRKRKGK